MTKNEKVISDMELDMVVGGASALFLKKREDGKIDAFTISGNGDIDTLRKVYNGTPASQMNVKCQAKLSEGIRADKVDLFIERTQKKHPDLQVEWVN